MQKRVVFCLFFALLAAAAVILVVTIRGIFGDGRKAVAATPDQLKGVHPVLDWSDRLIGGVVDGEWRGRNEVAARLTGDEKYVFYSRLGKLGEDSGVKVREETYFTGENGYFFDFGTNFNGAAFGISCAWNPLPRTTWAKQYSRSPESLKSLLQSYLDDAGITAAGVSVRETLSMDLHGDGREEAIVYATNIKQRDIDDLVNGKAEEAYDRYSVVLLYPEGTDAGPPLALGECRDGMSEFAIQFVADVDGDGIMEIMMREEILDALPAEGFSPSNERLLKVRGRRITTMVEINSSPV